MVELRRDKGERFWLWNSLKTHQFEIYIVPSLLSSFIIKEKKEASFQIIFSFHFIKMHWNSCANHLWALVLRSWLTPFSNTFSIDLSSSVRLYTPRQEWLVMYIGRAADHLHAMFRSVVLNRAGGRLLCPPRNSKGPVSGDILGISQLEGCSGHVVEEVRGAAKHPVAPGSSPTPNKELSCPRYQ